MSDSTPAPNSPPPADSERGNTPRTLLARAKENDPTAWGRLVHLYTPLVYHWCGRCGVRRPDADDIVQEVFRAALGSLGGFRRDHPGATFRGWLRGVTRNTLNDHFRRAGREVRAEGGTDAYLRMHGVAARPAEPADEADPPAELSGLYRRALELVRGEFEDRTWRAFWQAAVDGRRPADVAADLGVTAAAVRQAKSRVLRRLREEIGDLGD
jgi:RNA polymerase sigma-70 factor (ECF subfamily)